MSVFSQPEWQAVPAEMGTGSVSLEIVTTRPGVVVLKLRNTLPHVRGLVLGRPDADTHLVGIFTDDERPRDLLRKNADSTVKVSEASLDGDFQVKMLADLSKTEKLLMVLEREDGSVLPITISKRSGFDQASIAFFFNGEPCYTVKAECKSRGDMKKECCSDSMSPCIDCVDCKINCPECTLLP